MLCYPSFTGQLARHIFEDLRRKEAAALKIQRALRIYLDRRSYKEAVVTVQSGLRGMAARNVLGRKTKATLAIQVVKPLSLFFFFLSSLSFSHPSKFLLDSEFNFFHCIYQIHCRRYLAESHYKKLKKAAITTQSAWRARLARKELRELKMVSLIFFYFSVLSILHGRRA